MAPLGALCYSYFSACRFCQVAFFGPQGFLLFSRHASGCDCLQLVVWALRHAFSRTEGSDGPIASCVEGFLLKCGIELATAFFEVYHPVFKSVARYQLSTFEASLLHQEIPLQPAFCALSDELGRLAPQFPEVDLLLLHAGLDSAFGCLLDLGERVSRRI